MDTIKVLTGKSVDRILAEGGTSSWKLDRKRAERALYAVCYRNVDRATELGDGLTPEPHGAGFLIGKVQAVIPSPDSPGRWLITFSEYARLDYSVRWAGDRNPVIYDSIADIRIEVGELEWHPMPETENTYPASPSTGFRGLSIAEAKAGLALQFGIGEDQIHIRIEA